MKNIKKLGLVILSTLFIFMSGCGYKEGVISEEKVAYLYFTGNAKGAEVSIDATTVFIVEAVGEEEHYKVSTGNHIVIVRKNGVVVVKRKLLLGDGIAREINVP